MRWSVCYPIKIKAAGYKEMVTQKQRLSESQHQASVTPMPSPKSALATALDYMLRGLSVIPVPYKTKSPVIKAWRSLSLREPDLPKVFNGQHQNIGGLLGDPSGSLVDIDLDALEVRMLSNVSPGAVP